MARTAKEFPTVDPAKLSDLIGDDAEHVQTVYFETTVKDKEGNKKKVVASALAPKISTEGVIAWGKLIEATREQVKDDKGNVTFPTGNEDIAQRIFYDQVSSVASRVTAENAADSSTWITPASSKRTLDVEEMRMRVFASIWQKHSRPPKDQKEFHAEAAEMFDGISLK